MGNQLIVQKGLKVIAVITVMLIAMGIFDFARTTISYKKPIFAQLKIETSTDDFGSGRYQGIGYAVDLEDYMPEEAAKPLDGPLSGADAVHFYVLGIKVRSVERDWIN